MSKVETKIGEVKFVGLSDGTIFKVIQLSPRKTDQYMLSASGEWSLNGEDYRAWPESVDIETTSSRDIQLWALNFQIERLKKFKVEDKPMHFNSKNSMYSKGDEDASFISEGFLYPLIGKEDARSVLGNVYRIESYLKKHVWSK